MEKLDNLVSWLADSPIVTKINSLPGGILTDETVDEYQEIEEHLEMVGIVD